MTEIINVNDLQDGIDRGVAYIHSKWGNESNYSFYQNAIINSSLPGKKLPKFFLMIDDMRIIGCCGLISNDFISREDLYPWLCGLFVEENERHHGYGGQLIAHIESAAKMEMFKSLYLTTHLDGYYEKYGWVRIEDGYSLDGTQTRIYQKSI